MLKIKNESKKLSYTINDIMMFTEKILKEYEEFKKNPKIVPK